MTSSKSYYTHSFHNALGMALHTFRAYAQTWIYKNIQDLLLPALKMMQHKLHAELCCDIAVTVCCQQNSSCINHLSACTFMNYCLHGLVALFQSCWRCCCCLHAGIFFFCSHFKNLFIAETNFSQIGQLNKSQWGPKKNHFCYWVSWESQLRTTQRVIWSHCPPSYSAASISTFIICVFCMYFLFNTKHIILYYTIIISCLLLLTFEFNFYKTIHMTCRSIF